MSRHINIIQLDTANSIMQICDITLMVITMHQLLCTFQRDQMTQIEVIINEQRSFVGRAEIKITTILFQQK